MTDKIYEYKDEQNWFIGQWGDYEYVSSFLVDNYWGELKSIFDQLYAHRFEEMSYFQLHIVRYQSKERLIRFLVDMVNERDNRQLEVAVRQGVILVTEGDQLLLVHLPEGGVKTADFLGGGKSVSDTILIATKNEGKTKEFRAFFAKLGYEVENLNDYPDLPDVAETGMTFEENARLKAETIAQLTGKMVLADDSGLKVDKLGGLPGVWSARFSGPDATDASNRAKLLHELAMVFEPKDRSAQFHCTLVLAAPGHDSLVVEADWPGYIAFEEKGEHGFGYDSIFMVEQERKTSAELGLDYKNKYSHRALALNTLWEEFPKWQEEIRTKS